MGAHYGWFAIAIASAVGAGVAFWFLISPVFGVGLALLITGAGSVAFITHHVSLFFGLVAATIGGSLVAVPFFH
jgi:hypothetical protein